MKTHKVRLKNGLTLSLAGEPMDRSNTLRLHPPGGGPFLLSLTVPGRVGSKVLQGARLHYAALLPEDLSQARKEAPASAMTQEMPPEDLSPVDAFRWVAIEGRRRYPVPPRGITRKEMEARRRKTEEEVRGYLASYALWTQDLSWGNLPLYERLAYLFPVEGTYSELFFNFRKLLDQRTFLQTYSWSLRTATLLHGKVFSAASEEKLEAVAMNHMVWGVYGLLPFLPTPLRAEVPSLTPSQVGMLQEMPSPSSPWGAAHLFSLLQQEAWPSRGRREHLLKEMDAAQKEHARRRWEEARETPRAKAPWNSLEWTFDRRAKYTGPQGLRLFEHLLQESARGNAVAQDCLDFFFQKERRPIFAPLLFAGAGPSYAEEECLLSRFLQEMSLEEFLPQLRRFLLLEDPLTAEEALQYLEGWEAFKEMPSSWWLPLLRPQGNALEG